MESKYSQEEREAGRLEIIERDLRSTVSRIDDIISTLQGRANRINGYSEASTTECAINAGGKSVDLPAMLDEIQSCVIRLGHLENRLLFLDRHLQSVVG